MGFDLHFEKCVGLEILHGERPQGTAEGKTNKVLNTKKNRLANWQVLGSSLLVMDQC